MLISDYLRQRREAHRSLRLEANSIAMGLGFGFAFVAILSLFVP